MPTLHDQIETSYVGAESLPWIPFTPYSDEVLLKYWKIDPVRGEIVVSMRFPPGLELPTHYHTGIVVAHTIRGAWRYIEHDWVSGTGDTVYGDRSLLAHAAERRRGRRRGLLLHHRRARVRATRAATCWHARTPGRRSRATGLTARPTACRLRI